MPVRELWTPDDDGEIWAEFGPFPAAPTHPDSVWARSARIYVSSGHGDDRNDGLSWATARRTVKLATPLLAPGGTLLIGAGVYVGEKLDLNQYSAHFETQQKDEKVCMMGCTIKLPKKNGPR